MSEVNISNDWHLDKRVPIALILTLLAQSAGAIWWASSVNSRIAQLESRVSVTESIRVDMIETKQLARITAERLRRIEDKLDEMQKDGGRQ